MPVKPGLSAELSFTVGEGDTAEALGSGEVPVLGSPRVLAMVEAATLKALTGQLGPGETSVGVKIQVEHVAPTAVGNVVTAEATVEKINGRRITFTVSARDERSLIAAGRVTRVVVNRERFLDKIR